jgi:hypothetical protein
MMSASRLVLAMLMMSAVTDIHDKVKDGQHLLLTQAVPEPSPLSLWANGVNLKQG